MGDLGGKLSSLKISVDRVVSKFRSALDGHLPQFEGSPKVDPPDMAPVYWTTIM